MDTEFIWTRTYKPRLGLIQIALSDEDCRLIDPLAIEDLSPLGELLADPKVVKIFHDAPQDLAILHSATGKVARNIFDTKLAAGFAGLSSSLSLGNLIEKLLDIHLAKTETRTNWLKRPLNTKQVSYALDDVRYLRAVRVLLLNRIIGPEIKSWLQEELNLFNDTAHYICDNRKNRYHKIRGSKDLDARSLAILRELSFWREQTAMQKDRPRGHILPCPTLIALCKKRPRTLKELKELDGISENALKLYGSMLLKAVDAGLGCPAENLPHPQKTIRLNQKENNALRQLHEFIQLKSSVQQIDPALIGNSTELKQLIKHLFSQNSPPPPRQTQGWRKRFLADFFRYSI
ncbi:unnamed protein product [Cyprideis torosa]|uniref:Uncharacterized protein n=1 Tax=Cyprideis torosa TaxID=163714 RepID=A0A7R8ZTR7_9CRUS|nr:unnamed protein product [Cyprideis torosa]CAG0908639.1 unnamed protein product [Cyprideis torosa]